MSAQGVQVTVAERAALLRACHCEELKLTQDLQNARDACAAKAPNAAAKLAVIESELQVLQAAIRKLWVG